MSSRYSLRQGNELLVFSGGRRYSFVCHVLQILNQSHCTVIAAVRSPAQAVHLQDLQKRYDGRLTLVTLDLSEPSTAQVCGYLGALSTV